LGFPTTRTAGQEFIFFQTAGVCLALYPYAELARDVSDRLPADRSKFTGITIAHNVRQRQEVDQILEQARRAGAKIEKPAQDTFWGGYSGYFSDPDGYLWEVAWGAFEFQDEGSLKIT
jgi:predicted lactoylglutathione lyase